MKEKEFDSFLPTPSEGPAFPPYYTGYFGKVGGLWAVKMGSWERSKEKLLCAHQIIAHSKEKSCAMKWHRPDLVWWVIKNPRGPILIYKVSGWKFWETYSYELVPFTYQTAIKIGVKNAFSSIQRKHENKITFETPYKVFQKGVKVIQCSIGY